MDLNTLGYLAGVIDGEGYIGIEKTKPNKNQRQINPRYMPNICVVNTNKKLIDFLQKKWGGSIQQRNRNGKWMKNYYKTCWRWRLNQGRIVEFLTAIRPYMIVKIEQADLLLKYYQERMKPIRGTFQGRHGVKEYPPEEMEFREKIYKEIKKLNHYDPQRLNEETPTNKMEGDATVQTYEKS